MRTLGNGRGGIDTRPKQICAFAAAMSLKVRLPKLVFDEICDLGGRISTKLCRTLGWYERLDLSVSIYEGQKTLTNFGEMYNKMSTTFICGTFPACSRIALEEVLRCIFFTT